MKLSTFAVASLAACDLNQAGNLGATKLGDTSHPLATGSPIDAVRAACGSPTEVAPAIHRRPYLQRVTATSSQIGWVSVSPEGEHVELTTPGGAAMANRDGVAAEASRRSAGEQQMWATLEALEPGAIHCYALAAGDPRVGRTGFRTAPLATSTDTIRFLAFGDSGGGGPDQVALRDQMLRFPYDFAIHTGDLAYDSGTIAQLENTVFAMYGELLANLPLFPAAGNHDYETMRGAPFRDVFALTGDHAWYAYDWGRIHFVALDTEADYATQAAWLDADLAATVAPWRIVYMHRPPYSSGHHGSDVALRRAIAPVVERHHVQLVLAGHDHNYERMLPQNGVAYVVTGGGGRGTYPVGASSFTAFSESVIHFVIVEVGVDTLTLHAIDARGTEFDSLVISR